jgi:hypothetical protein
LTELAEHLCWNKSFNVIMLLFDPLPLDRGKGEPEGVVQAPVGDDITIYKRVVCIWLVLLTTFLVVNLIIIPCPYSNCIVQVLYLLCDSVEFWPNSEQPFARSCFRSAHLLGRRFSAYYPVDVMPRLAAHSESEESVKDKSEPPVEQNGDGEVEEVEVGEEGDVSEYEIEEVLDAKRGVFPDVRALSYQNFFTLN